MTSSLNRLNPLPPIPNETMSGTPGSNATTATTTSKVAATTTKQSSEKTNAAVKAQQLSDSSVEDMFKEMEIRTKYLQNVNDFSTDKYSEDLNFLSAVSKYRGSDPQVSSA